MLIKLTVNILFEHTIYFSTHSVHSTKSSLNCLHHAATTYILSKTILVCNNAISAQLNCYCNSYKLFNLHFSGHKTSSAYFFYTITQYIQRKCTQCLQYVHADILYYYTIPCFNSQLSVTPKGKFYLHSAGKTSFTSPLDDVVYCS